MLSKLREPVNGLTHFFTATAAFSGTVFLLYLSRMQLYKQISLTIYGFSLIALFSASAAYHLIQTTPMKLELLRKLDHSAIYIFIAGSYTPIFFNMFSGFWKWGFLAIIWSFALIGIVIKLFIIKAPRWTTAGVYLVMGWLSIFSIRQMMSVLPAGALFWIAAGGIIYTLGAVIYITKIFNFSPGKFGFHEVWHIFVILGALSHFIAVVMYIAPSA